VIVFAHLLFVRLRCQLLGHRWRTFHSFYHDRLGRRVNLAAHERCMRCKRFKDDVEES